MAGKIIGRIPTVDYGYVEIEADNFQEFVELDASVRDHVFGEVAGATDTAVQNLQNGGVAQTGLAGAGRPQWQNNGGGNNAGNSGGGNQKYKVLGNDPFTGAEVKIEFEGKFGPYVKDGQTNANVPKGKDPQSVTLQDACGYLAARRVG